MPTLDALLAAGAPPLVAILRGLRSDEAVAVGRALVAAGVRMIEVPLNSLDPFASIAALQNAFGGEALIGAGTVLDPAAVERLAATGARLMVTPNVVPEVIAAGLVRGLEVMPGFLTPSEAVTTVAAGARRLKLFPAGSLGPGHLKAVREVLPPDVGVWAVGGVTPDNVAAWLGAGAAGIAVGGSLYHPGTTPELAGERAGALVAALASALL